MTTTSAAPIRSAEQRMEALELANRVRCYRAQLKRDIRAGRKSALDILRNPPEEVETMKVWDLLLAMPRVGQTKANKFLWRTRTSPSKTLGGLSIRQRSALLDALIVDIERREERKAA